MCYGQTSAAQAPRVTLAGMLHSGPQGAPAAVSAHGSPPMYLDAWGGQPTNPWQLDLEQQQQPATAHALFVPTAGAAGLDLSAAFLSPAWQAAAYQAQQQDGSQQSEDGVGKGRLRWSAALHTQFVDAVRQLGGALQATPKRILALMGVPGLTLYHIKSHLQKYRNALAPSTGRRRVGTAVVAGKRRVAAAKRSAASMRATDSGSDSDEWEEVGEHEGLTLGLGGCSAQLSRRSSHKLAKPQPEEERQQEQAAAAQAAAVAPAILPCMAAPQQPQQRTDSPCAVAGVSMVWGSDSDLAVVDAELAALGELDAQLAEDGRLSGNDDDDLTDCLVDLPAGLQQLDRELRQQASGSATQASAGHSSGGGSGGPCSSALRPALPPVPAPAPAPASPLPAAAAGPAGAAAGGDAANNNSSNRSGSRQEELLQTALELQMQMQKQLSSAMEAQRKLQQQLEAHGRYVEALLRSEGGLLARPTAGSKGRGAASQASRRGVATSSSSGRSRAGGLHAFPCIAHEAEPSRMRRIGSAPHLLAAASGYADVPPLQLPVGPGPAPAQLPCWHLDQRFVPQPPQPTDLEMFQQLPKQEQQQVAQDLARLVAGGSLSAVDLLQEVQEGVSCAPLTPEDVELLMATHGSSPAAPQQQQPQLSRPQPTATSGGSAGTVAGATCSESAWAPAAAPQQQPLLLPGMDPLMGASVWDSLLADSGALSPLLSDL